jgi:hypothetical protein
MRSSMFNVHNTVITFYKLTGWFNLNIPFNKRECFRLTDF